MTGYCILVQKTHHGFHVLLGALAGHIVHTLLKIVHGDLADFQIPDREELLQRSPVAVHGGLALFVGGFPFVPELDEGDLAGFLHPVLLHQLGQIGQGFFFRLEAGLGNGLLVGVSFLVNYLCSDDTDGDPCSVAALVNAAGSVAPAFGVLGHTLLGTADVTELGAFRQLRATLSTFHKLDFLSWLCYHERADSLNVR